MAVTPNIGLVKQAGTEYGDYEITNENWDKIDEEMGKRGKTVNGVQPDDEGDYKVTEVTFARQIVADDAQQSSDEFLFRTTGGEASLSDGDAKLIAIFGRMLHTGVVEESLQMTVNAAERDPGEETITAQIDRDTFVAYVADSGTITLTYTDAWSANPTLYGVTVEGYPVSGDQIVIVYVKENRGLITPSAPNKFISTGWNLYNNTLGYARVKKYSNSYGFLIGGTYTKVEFATTPTGTKTTITPASGYFTVPSDGYVIVTGGNATDTYILMTWSDWSEGYEGSWKAYSESVVNLSSIMSNFTNGLQQVEGVADEINFGTGNAYSRIERMSYTAQNLADVIASGRPYDADTNYIYAVRSSEVVYSFSVSGSFTASDHGQEIIEGGTVPVFVQTLYGQNLVDKLRTDVVTKSQDLVNNLTSDATNKALTAAQGKALKAITDSLNSNLTNYIEESGQLKRFTAVDVNTIVDSGRYYLNSSCTNKPISGSGYLDVYKYSNNYVRQTLKAEANEFVYERQLSNGTWGSWSSLNSNLTTVNSLTAGTGVTISVGGYIKAGKIVTVSVRITTTQDLSTNSVILSGLPSGTGNGFIPYFTIGNGYEPMKYSCRLNNNNGDVHTNVAIPSGETVNVQGTYIANS